MIRTERAKREMVETTATDLRQQLAKVQTQLERMQVDAAKPPPRRPWWKF